MRTALLLASLLLAACSAPEDDTVVLDEEAATTLAQGAQRLAAGLEQGADCTALAEAAELADHARAGVTAGSVPTDVANEVEAVATEVTSGLSCDPDDEGVEPDGEDEPDGTENPDGTEDPGPDRSRDEDAPQRAAGSGAVHGAGVAAVTDPRP